MGIVAATHSPGEPDAGKPYKGLCEVLTPLMSPLQAKTLSEGWFARKPDAAEEVNKVLTSAGLSMDTVIPVELAPSSE